MTVRYDKHGHVALFTLDNGKVNAITPTRRIAKNRMSDSDLRQDAYDRVDQVWR